MKFFNTLYLVVLVALLCLTGCCSAVSAMGLNEIIELALIHDAQLRADIFAARARTAEGWQSVAGYGPTLSASGSYMRSRDFSKPDSGAGLEERLAHFSEAELTVTFEQPVIDLGKATDALRGMTEMDMAELLQKKAHEEMLLKVHERYYAVLSAQEKLRLAQAESEALRKQVQDAEQKLALGFGTITDQYTAEARYRLSLAAEIARKTELDNGLKALEEIIAREIVAGIEDLVQDYVLPTISKDVATWFAVSRAGNTDFSLKQLQAKTAQLEYRAAQSRFLPSLVVFADYSERHPDDGLLGYGEERSELDVGFRLEANLLAGGRDSAATVAASRRVQAAREQTTVAERALQRSVRSLWDSIHNTRQLVDAYRLAAAANEKALEATQASYDEGVKVLLDVLNAQQDYFRSLGQYKTSRYDYMLLLEKFRQVVGVETVAEEITQFNH